MSLSTEIIKKQVKDKFTAVDQKSLKRISKSKDDDGNCLRTFSSNLGTICVTSDSDDTTVISMELGDKPVSKSIKKNSSKIVVKDLGGNILFAKKTIEGESAADVFQCILEQESWIQELIFGILKIEDNGDNSFDHESWNTGSPSYDKNSVIKIMVGNKHTYNLTLE